MILKRFFYPCQSALPFGKPAVMTRTRRMPLAELMVLSALSLAMARVGSYWPDRIQPNAALDYGSSSIALPSLGDPSPSAWPLRDTELDLSYPEIASILRNRMSKRTSPATIRALSAQILGLCAELEFQPSFILAVIEHESAFKPRAVSAQGAMGLMQVLPATGNEVARRIGLKARRGWIDLRDPVTNVTLGMYYLHSLKRQFQTVESTLAAYNLGPARWLKLLRQPWRLRPGETLRYVALIQRTREHLKVESREAWRPELAARLGAGAWL